MAYAKTLTDDGRQEFITEIDGYTIRINKVGGGTLGVKYTDEFWEYEVGYKGEVLFHDIDLRIGMAATHLDAAIFASWFPNGENEDI